MFFLLLILETHYSYLGVYSFQETAKNFGHYFLRFFCGGWGAGCLLLQGLQLLMYQVIWNCFTTKLWVLCPIFKKFSVFSKDSCWIISIAPSSHLSFCGIQSALYPTPCSSPQTLYFSSLQFQCGSLVDVPCLFNMLYPSSTFPNIWNVATVTVSMS